MSAQVQTFSYMLDDMPDMPPEGAVPVVDTNVPMPKRPLNKRNTHTTREKIEAVANAAKVEAAMQGTDVAVSGMDEQSARQAFKDKREITNYELANKPGMVLKLNAMMDEYDRELIADATDIRVYVTNRLIEESTDEKPAIRLKALDMLGKLSDVAAFTERKEITINNQSTESLEETLRKKIDKILGKPIEGVTLDP